MTTFDLDGSHLSNCAEASILVTTDGLVDINNVTIESGAFGVKVKAGQGHFSLRNSAISRMTSTAVVVTYTDYSNAGNLTIENCKISSCESGIRHSSENFQTGSKTIIQNNTIQAINFDALVINIPKTQYNTIYNTLVERKIDVAQNTFDSACHILRPQPPAPHQACPLAPPRARRNRSRTAR